MDRMAAFLGLMAAAAAIGALAAAELVIVPGLGAATGYIDANLAKTLTAPLHLRCAEIVLGSCLVLLLVAPRVVVSRVGTTVALGAVGCAALYRLVMLPRLYEGWSRADLVAGRPADRIRDAEHLADQTLLLAAALAILLATSILLSVWGRAPSSSRPITPAAPDRAEPVGASAATTTA